MNIFKFSVFLLVLLGSCKSEPEPLVLNVKESDELHEFHFNQNNFTEDSLSVVMSMIDNGDIVGRVTLDFDEGTYELTNNMTFQSMSGFTIKGKGMDKTIFECKNMSGDDGILITDSKRVLLHDFTIRNTPKNGITARRCLGLRMKKLGAEWETRSLKNGLYGLYPVESEDVIVEDSYGLNALQSGMYSGQNKRVFIRNNEAEGGVIGLEVENTIDAEVYGNNFHNNTNGIAVYDLAGLKVIKNSRNCKVYDNTIINNNEPNIAFGKNEEVIGLVSENVSEGVLEIYQNTPLGDYVPGVGLLLACVRDVEVTGNKFIDNATIGVMGISYFFTDPNFNPVSDVRFKPLNGRISVYDNSFQDTGVKIADEVITASGGGKDLIQFRKDYLKQGGALPLEMAFDHQNFRRAGYPFKGDRAYIGDNKWRGNLVEISAIARGEPIAIVSMSADDFKNAEKTVYTKFEFKNDIPDAL